MIKTKFNIDNGRPDTTLIFRDNCKLEICILYSLFYSDLFTRYKYNNQATDIIFSNYDINIGKLWYDMITGKVNKPILNQEDIFELLNFLDIIEGGKYIDLNINFYTIIYNGNIQNQVKNIIPIKVKNYFGYVKDIYTYMKYKKNQDRHNFVEILNKLIFRRKNIFNDTQDWDMDDIISIANYSNKVKMIDRVEFMKFRKDVISNDIIKKNIDYVMCILQYYSDLIEYLDFNIVDLSNVSFVRDEIINFDIFIKLIPFKQFIISKFIYNKIFFQHTLEYDVNLLLENIEDISVFKHMFDVVDSKSKSIMLTTQFFWDNNCLDSV